MWYDRLDESLKMAICDQIMYGSIMNVFVFISFEDFIAILRKVVDFGMLHHVVFWSVRNTYPEDGGSMFFQSFWHTTKIGYCVATQNNITPSFVAFNGAGTSIEIQENDFVAPDRLEKL
jgi:hypothetical protein